MEKIIRFIIKPKTLIITFISMISINLAVSFFIKNLYKSRAAGEVININMSSTSSTLAPGASAVVNVDLTPSSGKISGFDLTFKTEGDLGILSLGTPVSVGVTGDVSSMFTSVLTGTNRIVYVIKKADVDLPYSVRIPVTVSATAPGQGTLMVDYSSDYRSSNSQVSGNISSNTFAFGAVQAMIFNPSSPTGGPVGNTTLNIKLKFQGITTSVTTDTMSVKIILKQGAGITVVATTPINFTVDTSGVWSGIMSANLTTAADYYLLVKGPMHIQKRICDNSPSETVGGKYSCATGAISITTGTTNTLDLTNIFMMAGDLPLTETNGQDGVADSVDIGYIINNLGSTDVDVAAIGDINRNGGIDAADFSATKYALGISPDEQ